MSEKKVVGRTVAIALGIIAIILAVGLVGAVADYTSIINGKENDVSTLTNQNGKLHTWLGANETLYDNYVANHHQTDSDYAYLQNQINYLYNITGLKNNITLSKGTEYVESLSKETVGLANSTYPGFYSGYMSFWIKTSTSNSTILTVTSTSPSGITIYNQTVHVGTNGGRMVFPVFRSNVTIILETTQPTMITDQENLYY
jgi:hypothetical protein